MKLHFLIGIFLFSGALAAQDIAFSQPFFAPLTIGPAQAGAAGVQRVNVLWKNQWPQLQGGFREMYFSYDQPSDLIHGGVGGYYHQSRDTNGITLYRTYGSANIHLINGGGNVRFVAGVEAGYVHGTLKFSRFSNAPEGLFSNDINYADVGVSLGVHSARYSFVAGVKHLNQPKAGFNSDADYRLPVKATGALTAIVPLGGRYGESDVSLCVFFTAQADTQALMLSMLWARSHYVIGTAMRNRDSWNVTAGLRFDRLLAVYTYDFCASSLAKRNPGGAHEVGVMIFLKKPDATRVFPSVEHNAYFLEPGNVPSR